MADEEIVSGLKNVETQISRQREDVNEQTRTLNDSINKLRAESNRESSGLVDTLTKSLKDQSAEVAAGLLIQQRSEAFQEREHITEVDDRVEEASQRAELSSIKTIDTLKQIDQDIQGIDPGPADTQQTGLLQRIAAFVNPDMMGSKDREKDLENKLRFETQLKWFKSMANSLTNLIPKPIKMAGTTILTFLKGLAIGGALLALLDFLDSETWKEWQGIIAEKLAPSLDAMFKWFSDFATDLGEWFNAEDGEENKSLLQTFSDNWKAFGVALGALAFLGPVALFAGAWKLGKWVFIAPLMALGKALFDLTKLGPVVAGISGAGALAGGAAAAEAAHRKTAIPKEGAKFEQGGQKFQFKADASRIGGGDFVHTEGSLKGQVASADVQKAGREKFGGAGRWKNLIAKYPGLKMAAGIGRGIAYPIAVALTAADVYSVLMGDGNFDEKTTAVTRALGAGLLGTIGGALGAAGGTMIFPGIGTLLGAAVFGSLGYFGGDWAGKHIAELLLDNEQSSRTQDKMEKWSKKTTENLSMEGGTTFPQQQTNFASIAGSKSNINLVGSSGNDTLGAPTPTTNITPTPRTAPAQTLTMASLDKATRGIGMGDTTPNMNVVNAPTNVQSNTHNEFSTAKSIKNPDPLLSAVNYSYA